MEQIVVGKHRLFNIFFELVIHFHLMLVLLLLVLLNYNICINEYNAYVHIYSSLETRLNK
jgi:hypothetical protein